MAQTTSINLPERMDARAVAALAQSFLAQRGTALDLDASRVGYLGAGALQLLIMARQQWAADGQTLHISAASPAFDQGLIDLGTTRERLMKGDF